MKESAPAIDRPGWTATLTAAVLAEEFPDTPLASDAGWQPLQQAWNPHRPDHGFQPGWARISWSPAALTYDAVLAGKTFRNSATRLNQLTWELGDVCEVFVQADGSPYYLEVHITPENQRLQLRFPPDGIAAVRSGRVPLADFMVADPDWVQTSTQLGGGLFKVRAVLPVEILGLENVRLNPAIRLRTAVCRYDYPSPREKPVLSSTAPLRAPFFHQREEWQRLQLITP